MYSFLRVWVVPLAIIGWVIHQLVIKKKSLAEIKGDLLIICFFLAVWMLIFFVFLS